MCVFLKFNIYRFLWCFPLGTSFIPTVAVFYHSSVICVQISTEYILKYSLLFSLGVEEYEEAGDTDGEETA